MLAENKLLTKICQQLRCYTMTTVCNGPTHKDRTVILKLDLAGPVSHGLCGACLAEYVAELEELKNAQIQISRRGMSDRQTIATNN